MDFYSLFRLVSVILYLSLSISVMEIVIPLKKVWKTFLSITDEPLVFNANANRCPANLWLAKFYNGTFVLPLHESLWPDNWRLCRKNRNSNCKYNYNFDIFLKKISFLSTFPLFYIRSGLSDFSTTTRNTDITTTYEASVRNVR